MFQTILDLSDDLKELEGEEAGYWAAPSTIRALQSIFTRLALDRITAGGSIAIVPNLIKEFPTLGLIFGEPNDGMSAIDAFLDKLPEALKSPLKLDAVAVDDSIMVTPYCKANRDFDLCPRYTAELQGGTDGVPGWQSLSY